MAISHGVALPPLLLVWIFNVWGTLDLLNARYTGFRLSQDTALGATYFIPAVAVPAFLVAHFVVFRELLKKRPEPEHA